MSNDTMPYGQNRCSWIKKSGRQKSVAETVLTAVVRNIGLNCEPVQQYHAKVENVVMEPKLKSVSAEAVALEQRNKTLSIVKNVAERTSHKLWLN